MKKIKLKFQFKLNYIFLSITFLLLSACGGDKTTIKPVTPEPAQFTTNVYVSTFDSCGEIVPFHGAQVVFYKQDSTTIDKTVTVNSQGLASYKQENETISLSVITNTSVEDKHFKVDSLIDIESSKSYQVNADSDIQGNCQCTETSITVDFPAYAQQGLEYARLELPNKSIYVYAGNFEEEGAPYIIGATAYFPNIEICSGNLDVVFINAQDPSWSNGVDDFYLDVPVENTISFIAENTKNGFIDLFQLFDIEFKSIYEPGAVRAYHRLIKDNIHYPLYLFDEGFARFDHFPSDGHYYQYTKHLNYEKGVLLSHARLVPADYNSPLQPNFPEISEFNVLYSNKTFTWPDIDLYGFSRVTARLEASEFNEDGTYQYYVDWEIYSKTTAANIIIPSLPSTLGWIEESFFPVDFRVGKYEGVDSFQQQIEHIYSGETTEQLRDRIAQSSGLITSSSALSFYRLIEGRSQWFIFDRNINN